MQATIIGGGITGLTVACMLENLGINYQLYEATPEFRHVGAGIILSPNALFVFDQLGLMPKLEAASFPLHRFDIVDQSGRLIQKNETAFEQGGQAYHSLGIHRGDLQSILLESIPQEKRHLGKRLAEYRPELKHVTFDDGDEIPVDYLLACDGIHSTVRQTIFPDAQLRYSGQTCWRGVATTNLRPEQLNAPAEMWGEGVRFGYVPLAADQTYWYATDAVPQNGKDDDLEGAKRDLEEMFRRFPSVVSEIISQTDHIIRHDLVDLALLSRWSAGSALLLGDAAHAMTPNLGQGAAQGIEDAWAIGNALSQHANPREAFV
ncbi:MAG: FAD-dependent monooxygenase, partial [Chloroflexota bacterium]